MKHLKALARAAAFLPLLSASLSQPAAAGPLNVLTDGNFDTSPGGSSLSTQFGSAGYASLPGWTVTANAHSTPFDLWWVAATASTVSALTQYGNSGQKLVSSYAGADGGNPNFVALDGDSRATGILSQTVNNLVIGDHYQLTFDWAATQMITGSRVPYTIALAFNLGTALLTNGRGAPQTATFSAAAYGQSSGWETVTATFTATQASEILSFLALGNPVGAPPIALLDNVTLDDIPAPSGLACLGGALLLGAMVARRRRVIE